MSKFQHGEDVNTIFIDQVRFDLQYNFHSNQLVTALNIYFCLSYRI